MLPIIAEHISTLVKDVGRREGETVGRISPTARAIDNDDLFGSSSPKKRASTTTSGSGSLASSSGNGKHSSCGEVLSECSGESTEQDNIRRNKPLTSTPARIADANTGTFNTFVEGTPRPTMGTPAKRKELRRVGSIRDLLLGERQDGERLKYFAWQMGLPHDLVVEQFQVCIAPPLSSAHRKRVKARVCLIYDLSCPLDQRVLPCDEIVSF